MYCLFGIFIIKCTSQLLYFYYINPFFLYIYIVESGQLCASWVVLQSHLIVIYAKTGSPLIHSQHSQSQPLNQCHSFCQVILNFGSNWWLPVTDLCFVLHNWSALIRAQTITPLQYFLVLALYFTKLAVTWNVTEQMGENGHFWSFSTETVCFSDLEKERGCSFLSDISPPEILGARGHTKRGCLLC